MSSRSYRYVPRDGAALFFEPSSGRNVLVRGERTRALRARAPRTVMFGPTNACNLRCGYCSRDTSAASAWDDESALAMLAGLAERGVLEVALGGGEPLVFRGLERLLERLRAETSLAVHVTTNAVLLDRARLHVLRPLLGEIRVSIHDEGPWPDRIAMLAEAGGSFGANVLVTADRVAGLGALLARLEALGCPDVALLRYVGPDARLALSRRDEHELAAVARDTSMRVRASVCFGDRLGLPSLRTDGGDCGAGGDFVVLSTDRKVRACSFGGGGVPVETPDDVIAVWRRERARLSAAVELPGCARREERAERASADGAFVWQAFSGNNSGDCFLVGKFARAAEAEAFVRHVEAHRPSEPPPARTWDTGTSPMPPAIFEGSGIELGTDERMPEELVAVGRSVLGWTRSAAGDDFPSLRALVWRRGGHVVANGIHVHEPVKLLTAVRPGPSSLDDVEARAVLAELGACARRGDVLYGIGALDRGQGLAAAIASWRAAAPDAPLAAEIVVDDPPVPLGHVLSARPSPGEKEWLVGHARGEGAARVAADHPDHVAVGGGLVVVARTHARAHDGARASRWGTAFRVVRGDVLVVGVTLYRFPHDAKAAPLDPAALERELRAELGATERLEGPLAVEWQAVRGTLHTAQPRALLPFLDAFAAARGLRAWAGARSVEPWADAIERIDVDLRALRRERR